MSEKQPNIRECLRLKVMEVMSLILLMKIRLRQVFIGKTDTSGEQMEQDGDLGLPDEYKKNPDESIKDYLERLKREFQSKEEKAYIDLLAGLALVWAYAEDKLTDFQPSSVNGDNRPSVVINRNLQSVMLYSLNRIIAIFENKYQASLKKTKEASRRNATPIENFINSLKVVRKSFLTSDQEINIDFDDFIVNSTRIQADAVLVDLKVPSALLGELTDYFKKLIDENNQRFFDVADDIFNATDDE